MIVLLGPQIRPSLITRLRRGRPPRGFKPQPQRRGRHECLHRLPVGAARPEEAAVARVARDLVGLRHQGLEASDEGLASVGEHLAMANRGTFTAG